MNSDSQASSPTVYQSPPAYGNEISLTDIINILWCRKKIILGITVVAVVIGFFYAFTQQRIYQVETILLPPLYENIQPLNLLNNYNINDNQLSSNTVFESFVGNINSRKFKKIFFDKYKVLETLSAGSNQILTENDINIVFEGFSNAIKVKRGNNISITLDGVDKKRLGPWLDSFVAMADQETINQLKRNLQAEIDSKINSIKIEISSKRSIYKQRREDELRRLEEAYQIANELGIREHLFVPNIDGSFNRAVSAELNSISKSLSNENNLSVYMKGTKVLQAEINALKNRKSDDFHIKGLRDLQEQLTRLRAITVKKDKLQTVIVDKKASVDVKPIRPNRKLIVMLSLVFGVALGVFSVFMVEFLTNVKKQMDKMGTV